MYMAWLEKLHHPEDYVKTFLKWGFLGVLMGTVGGIMGALFHHALHFVTHIRSEHMWLIFLLPLGGLATVMIYRLFGMQGNRGTNEIIDATLDGHAVSPMVAPSIFLATAITHLFGGSAGREGAALQLGGSTASVLANLFHLKTEERKVMVMAGMSAVFACRNPYSDRSVPDYCCELLAVSGTGSTGISAGNSHVLGIPSGRTFCGTSSADSFYPDFYRWFCDHAPYPAGGRSSV